MRRRRHPVSILWAAWCFRSQRADYYDFLAQYLKHSAANRTLLEVFQQDAERHGPGSSRGRLAAWWSLRFPANGGDLPETWQGTLPIEDLHCLGLAQNAGQPALLMTLHALAAQIRLTQKSTRHFWQTIFTGVMALCIGMATLMLLPLYAAPKLMQAFSAVPATLYGVQTQRLITWSTWLEHHGWLLPLVSLLTLGAGFWSLSYVIGPVRQWLDPFGPWRLYRDMQAIRFLTTTATLLRSLQERGVTLREVLLMQQNGVNRWLGWHLQRMVVQIDTGLDPLEALETGLLSAQARWCLMDVVRVRGLSEGLLVACAQIGDHLTQSMAKRAVIWRWFLLLAALGTVFAVGVWHMEVIEEMRRALTLVYGV